MRFLQVSGESENAGFASVWLCAICRVKFISAISRFLHLYERLFLALSIMLQFGFRCLQYIRETAE
jgi:hypothetical protein